MRPSSAISVGDIHAAVVNVRFAAGNVDFQRRFDQAQTLLRSSGVVSQQLSAISLMLAIAKTPGGNFFAGGELPPPCVAAYVIRRSISSRRGALRSGYHRREDLTGMGSAAAGGAEAAAPR